MKDSTPYAKMTDNTTLTPTVTPTELIHLKVVDSENPAEVGTERIVRGEATEATEVQSIEKKLEALARSLENVTISQAEYEAFAKKFRAEIDALKEDEDDEEEEKDDSETSIWVILRGWDEKVQKVWDDMNVFKKHGYDWVGASSMYLGRENQFSGPSENKSSLVKDIREYLAKAYGEHSNGLVDYWVFENASDMWKIEETLRNANRKFGKEALMTKNAYAGPRA